MTPAERIEKIREDLKVMDALCAASTSDAATRNYERRRAEFVAELVELEREQKKFPRDA